LLGFTNPLMNQGKPVPISLMQWRSKRLRRKASSPLLCEVISLSGVAGALERLDAFFQSICQSNYSLRRGSSLKISIRKFLEKPQSLRMIEAPTVMAAKSLFDAFNS